MNFSKLLLLSGGFVAAYSALACTCFNSLDPREAMGEVEAVFAGRAIEVRPLMGESPNGSRVESFATTFDVDRVWKGDIVKRVTVTTNASGGMCGYRFKAEQSYIVYGFGTGEKFNTHRCTATKPLEKAQNDKRDLGDGHEPR